MLIVNGDVILLAWRWSRLSGAERGPITAIACKIVSKQDELKYTLVTSPNTNAKTTIWARASGAVLDTSCTIDICAGLRPMQSVYAGGGREFVSRRYQHNLALMVPTAIRYCTRVEPTDDSNAMGRTCFLHASAQW